MLLSQGIKRDQLMPGVNLGRSMVDIEVYRPFFCLRRRVRPDFQLDQLTFAPAYRGQLESGTSPVRISARRFLSGSGK